MIKISKFIVLVLCLTVVFILPVSCAKSITESTTTTTTSTTELDAAQIVGRASEKMDATDSFHFLLDQVGGGTPIGMGIEMTKVEGDTIRPDRLQAAITGTISGMTISVQMISIGSVVYMTNPLSGKWEELPSQFAALSVFNPNSGITKIMRDIVNPIMVNKEQSGGVDCYHVSGSIDSESLSAMTGSSLKGTTVNVELWIGIDDFLLHNIKLAGKITETEVSGIVRTLTLSDFDKALTIELPE